MQQVLLIFSLLINIYSVQSQDSWSILGMVTFEEKFDESFGMDLQYPKYSPVLMQLDGKEIEVEGYFIALDGKKEQNHFMLSKFPQSTCFFCGKAGPETAMQVFLANEKKLAYTDEKVKVKGKLRINNSDPTSLLYTLDKATVLNE